MNPPEGFELVTDPSEIAKRGWMFRHKLRAKPWEPVTGWPDRRVGDFPSWEFARPIPEPAFEPVPITLPEGWEAAGFRQPEDGEYYIGNNCGLGAVCIHKRRGERAGGEAIIVRRKPERTWPPSGEGLKELRGWMVCSAEDGDYLYRRYIDRDGCWHYRQVFRDDYLTGAPIPEPPDGGKWHPIIGLDEVGK